MALDRILHGLEQSRLDSQEQVELARLGFLEWLWSLPYESDINAQASAAHEYACPMKGGAPAVAAFCDLLAAASQPLPTPVRTGGPRARRTPR